MGPVIPASLGQPSTAGTATFSGGRVGSGQFGQSREIWSVLPPDSTALMLIVRIAAVASRRTRAWNVGCSPSDSGVSCAV